MNPNMYECSTFSVVHSGGYVEVLKVPSQTKHGQCARPLNGVRKEAWEPRIPSPPESTNRLSHRPLLFRNHHHTSALVLKQHPRPQLTLTLNTNGSYQGNHLLSMPADISRLIVPAQQTARKTTGGKGCRGLAWFW